MVHLFTLYSNWNPDQKLIRGQMVVQSWAKCNSDFE